MPHGQERLRQEEEGKLPKLLLNSCFARKDGQEQESARLAEVALFLPSNFLSSLDSLQKSFLVNVGELFEHATAKKDDGESIINWVTFVADKIGKVGNWYYVALRLL